MQQVLEKYLATLRDDAALAWLPIVRDRHSWTSRLYHIVCVSMLTEVGKLAKRFLLDLDCWPWRLAGFLDLAFSAAEKVELADELNATRACDIDDTTEQIKARLPGGDAHDLMGDEDFLEYLHDFFANIPLTNIDSEVRFAGVNTRSFSSHGNAPSVETLAVEHVLDEAKLVLDSGIRCRLFANVEHPLFCFGCQHMC